MITMTCKCKKSTQLFKHMSAKHFPNGWETDCCVQAAQAEEMATLQGFGTDEEADAKYKAAEDAVFAEPEVQAVLEDLEAKDVAEKPKKKRKKKEEAPKAE